ncbi:MAG: EI24 domain-containing protein, partial [Leptospiraceae bacterium]|nr:EI24 domain-containing protein [Leptospiraceae bacterium]
MAEKEPGFFRRLIKGASAFWRAWTFLSENKLWTFMILPGMLSLMLAVGLIASLYMGLTGAIAGLIPQNQTGFLWSLLQGFLSFMIFVISVITTVFMYRILASVVVMPFLGPLLSRVETLLNGKATEVSISKDIKNAIVGIWVSLKYAFVEIIFLILTLFTGPVQPFIMAAVSGYFLGRGSFDYLLEKHTLSLRERKERAKEFWPEMEGLGVMHFITLFIPIIGPLAAPGVSVTGAA